MNGVTPKESGALMDAPLLMNNLTKSNMASL